MTTAYRFRVHATDARTGKPVFARPWLREVTDASQFAAYVRVRREFSVVFPGCRFTLELVDAKIRRAA